jgi:hypothetical protein
MPALRLGHARAPVLLTSLMRTGGVPGSPSRDRLMLCPCQAEASSGGAVVPMFATVPFVALSGFESPSRRALRPAWLLPLG